MKQPEKKPRCLRPDCQLVRLDGSSFCADHQLRQLSLAERLAAGPRWDGVEGASSVKLAICACCGDFVKRTDRTTGLCKTCWRCWRFAQATTAVAP